MLDPEVAIEHALDVLAEAAASDFSATMRTWQTHHPDVFIVKSKGLREIGIDDQIYSYISRGTDVRRVLLTGNLNATHGVTSVGKTSVGVISSAAGNQVGRVISRAFAFDGIKAREFDQQIAERIEREVLPQVLEDLADELVSMFTETMNQ